MSPRIITAVEVDALLTTRNALRDAAREYLAADAARSKAHEERMTATYCGTRDEIRAAEDAHFAAIDRLVSARKALRKLVEGDQ